MQKSIRILFAAALIALGIWGWRILFPSPEKIIRSRLADLAATLSFESGQGTIAQAFNAQKLKEFFTPDVEINVEPRGYPKLTVNGNDELAQIAMAARSTLGSLKVEFLDINVSLGADQQTAIVNLTCKATPGQRDYLVQEVNFMFRKVDKKWLIYRVESVKTLSLNDLPTPAMP